MVFLSRTARSLSARRRSPHRPTVPASCELLETRALLSGDGPLVISEFMADNSTGLRDENLEYSDWIEIQNPTADAINLDGYYLTDDPAVLTKWRLPAVTLAANGYRVVFASGKDRAPTAAGTQLHTNFKLASEGEYLALVQPDGVTVSDEYAPEYPEQVENVSYGVLNSAERYFTTPTPGAANNAGSTGLVSDTVFSVDRGFFDQPFQVSIATTTEGAQIRYTTNGAKPTATTGTVYSGPITVSKTTVLRAAAFKVGLVPSDVDTQTYLFVEDVVRQTAQTAVAMGLPATWGTVTPDYAMDSDVIGQTGPDLFNGQYAATIRDDLKAIPTMSIVLPAGDMFGSNGIYTNSTQRGDAWERGASVELIDPAGGQGDEFQVNAGVQIQGGAFRSHSLTLKHSFRLLFKDKWGVSKLSYPFFGNDSADEFQSITLRADANDGWQWTSAGAQALYARDAWSRQTQRDMGDPGADGNRVHLYINGVYWGLYTPTERPDAAFAASYIGGNEEDWDVLNQDGVTDGNNTAWNQMLALAEAVKNAPDEATRTAAYQRIQGNDPDGTDNPAYPDYLDVDNLIDYMLVNIFTGNVDWPHRNWYAGRLRADDGIGTDATGFKFFSWDAESALGLWADVNSNRTGANVGPAQPYDRLRSSPEFRARFADRVQQFMFNGGALSTEANKARMAAITDQIDRAIVAESARWGDQHRALPYTRADWANERNNLLRQGGYFDQRWPIVLGQLRAAGLYPAMDAPTFNRPAGEVPAGADVLVGASGAIYYTLDGSDPRLPGGEINPAAQSFTTAGATLIPKGSVWKYLDNGTDQGTAWRNDGFDDSSWASGPAQLGYGDNDEATPIGFGPDSANKYITSYFRHTFDVADPSQFTGLRLRLLRDDGAVVYVNGQRVLASNMNVDAAYNYRTPAIANIANADESTFYDFNLDPSVLRQGGNTIAVEIHQASGGSADVSFDLELAGVAPPQPVTLPGGTTVLGARVRDEAGNWSALSRAAYHTAAAASPANLVVTEVNYHPQAPEPALGETVSANRDDYEFLELMNTTGERITLAGAQFWLGIKLTFPLDAYLDPGERAVVVKNVDAFRSRYGDGPRVLGTYTGNLANNGQLTVLKDARGAVLESFRYNDSGDWPNRADGGGASLEVIDPTGDLGDPHNWRSSREYGGTPGTAGTGPVAGVIINEILSDSTAPADDAVELFNPTGEAIDLGGWYLSDSASNYRKYRIPDGTTLGAGGYLTFDEQALGFSLDSAGDDVWLMQADPATDRLTRFVDRVEFGAAADGESFGRWPSGDPDAGLYPMASTTLGEANAGPRVGPVVINEIHYNPAADGQEFVELRNLSGADVPLVGWRFNGGIDFTFPADAVIPADGYLLLVGGDPDAFRAANDVPADVPVLGPFTIGGFLNVLDDAGEKLALVRPVAGEPDVASEVERVRYGTAAPWPELPVAGGSSLSRRDSSAWADTASNWGAEADGGSPGRPNFGAGAATIAGRYVFYNNSVYDGGSAGAGAADDGAVATDKQVLLPGAGEATFANVTTYSRGINGLMIDIAGRAGGAAAPVAQDFPFAVLSGGAWVPAVAVPTVAVRPGAGVNGSDRVTITFPDGALKNTWLRVTTNPGAGTGLAAPDVFYVGNLVGDTGDGATTWRVNALDLAAVKRALNTIPDVTSRFDFNRDGRVNALDVAALKQNLTRSLGAMPAASAASASSVTTSAPFSTVPVAAVARAWDEPQPDVFGRDRV